VPTLWLFDVDGVSPPTQHPEVRRLFLVSSPDARDVPVASRNRAEFFDLPRLAVNCCHVSCTSLS